MHISLGPCNPSLHNASKLCLIVFLWFLYAQYVFFLCGRSQSFSSFSTYFSKIGLKFTIYSKISLKFIFVFRLKIGPKISNILSMVDELNISLTAWLWVIWGRTWNWLGEVPLLVQQRLEWQWKSARRRHWTPRKCRYRSPRGKSRRSPRCKCCLWPGTGSPSRAANQKIKFSGHSGVNLWN